jgi:hypothetical protein
MRTFHPAVVALLIAGGLVVALATAPPIAGSSWWGSVMGSGDVVTQERAVGPFERVIVNGSTDVDVSIDDAQSVTVEAQQNIEPLIETSVRDGVLVVSSRRSYTSHRNVAVHVTVPNLTGVATHGSADVTIDGARGPSLDLSTHGSGDITASGDVDRLFYNSSGSGDAKLADLRARDVTVRMRGSGDARLAVADSLDVEVSGSGDVTYSGTPSVLHQVVHGSGSVSAADGE